MKQDVRELLSEALLAAASQGPSPMLTISERALEAMVDAVRAAPISAMADGCAKEPRERLREIRQAKGLTQQELANKSGQSRMAVGAHESGQNNIRPEVAVKYAQALGCTPEWLLFGRDR